VFRDGVSRGYLAQASRAVFARSSRVRRTVAARWRASEPGFGFCQRLLSAVGRQREAPWVRAITAPRSANPARRPPVDGVR